MAPPSGQIVGRELLYLSRSQVIRCGVTMPRIIDGLQKMFASKSSVQNPPKPGVYPGGEGSFIHAMPAYVPSAKAAGCKWIAGYPENAAAGLPYINGLMLLNDPRTGMPKAIMDAAWITAMRTGAATGLAARYLARQDSRSVGMVACGVQGRVNLEALVSELPAIEKVTCYDPVDGVAAKFVDEMGTQIEASYGRTLTFEVTSELRMAVSNQDCVVTSAPWKPGVADDDKPIRAGWLSPGTFLSAVDMDASLQAAALSEAATLVTDDVAQWDHFVDKGVFADYRRPSCDLEALCSEHVSSAHARRRKTEEEICAAVCMGIACEDVVTAKLVMDRALEKGIGHVLPM